MAKAASKQATKQTQAVINTNAPTGNLSGNTGLPANTAAASMASMAATLTLQAQAPVKVTPAAKLAAMQAAGLAASGATALAHKAGSANLGKLPAGSFVVNPAKATMPSKPGFNATAWAAIVATGGGLPAALAQAVVTATGCSGSTASAHVGYRVKQGWLQPA